jgi:hypothetical protein
VNINHSPHERLGKALDDYFALSRILQTDMVVLRDSENETQPGRRNFIRAGAALIEGYAHSLREMCLVSFECSNVPAITAKEGKVIQSEKECDVIDRIKFTLRVAYKLFELSPAPNFGNREWLNAQLFLNKRNRLMHPKTSADLEVADASWNEMHGGAVWLMEQLFNFFSLLHEKHTGRSHPGGGA